MFTQQEQAPPTSAALISQKAEPAIYINSDGTIHSLNSSACDFFNLDTSNEAIGQSLNEFISFSLESLTSVYQNIFEGRFSESERTIIPSVNARYSYTFSFDTAINAVQLVIKENPFV